MKVTIQMVSFLILMVVFIAGPILSDDTVPDWLQGSWWEYTSVTDLHLQESGSAEFADIVTTDVATRYLLSSQETKTLTRGSALSYDAYVLPFSGVLNAAGVYHITDPIPMDVDIEIRNATLTGEWWVDSATIGTIYFHRHVLGPLWANIPFLGWQEVGTGEFDIHEEYEPPRDLCRFPIAVGNSDLLTISFFSYGNYILDYDIGSGPTHVEDTFDETVNYQFNLDVVLEEMSHGVMTYRIEGQETGSDSGVAANYGPEVRNLVYESLTDLSSGAGSVQINAMTRDLDGYSLVSDTTPTPTPDVTPTPIPTETPSPTPTTSPEDPTQTPLPPTPTAAMDTGIIIRTNQSVYREGDSFLCATDISNTGPAVLVHEYVVLDVYSSFWFWPGWMPEIDFETRTLAENSMYSNETILIFTWPEVSGTVSGIKFWAALLNPETNELVGDFGVVEWGYE